MSDLKTAIIAVMGLLLFVATVNAQETADAWYQKGWIVGNTFNESGQVDVQNKAEALQDLSKAVDLDPRNISCLEGKAFFLDQLGRTDEAIAICDEIIAINPQYYPALTDKADYLYGENKFSEANSVYDQVIAIQPNSIEAWAGKANALDSISLGSGDDADATLGRLTDHLNVMAPLSESDIAAIKKWYPIGIDTYHIAKDMGRGEDKVRDAIEELIKEGVLTRHPSYR